MRTVAIESFIGRVRKRLRWRAMDDFLRQVAGVIHVGANTGQERDLYDRYSLWVLWIEPIPEVFRELRENIVGRHRQCAFQALVSDSDGVEVPFYVANNQGASSSMLDLHLHREIWPTIEYDRTLQLRTTTLASLLRREAIDLTRYDALVIDTQGSELLVLKGAAEFLPAFTFIKVEVPDFEAYKGCCRVADVAAFLSERGWREYARERFAQRPGGGSYFDIVFRQHRASARVVQGTKP